MLEGASKKLNDGTPTLRDGGVCAQLENPESL